MTELFCLRCKYNLRGLPDDTNCPECGLPIADSRPSKNPSTLDRRWLARVRNGCLAMLVFELGFGACICFAPDRQIAAFLLLSAWFLLAGVGFFLITTPNQNSQPSQRFRRTVRGSAAVTALAAASPHVEFEFGMLFLSLSYLSIAVLIRYLATIAVTAPTRTHCKIVSIGITASVIVGCAGLFLVRSEALLMLALPSAGIFFVWSMAVFYRSLNDFDGALQP